MTRLIWDETGTRKYEGGLDRGVLYFGDGTVVPWNGLTKVERDAEEKGEEHYVDGVKYLARELSSSFVGTISAITYPDEFEAVLGLAEVRLGAYFRGQSPELFSMSFRTQVFNDISGEPIGYQIHVLTNILALMDNVAYSTDGAAFEAEEFSWSITTVPERLEALRPTAYIVLDSTELDEERWDAVQRKLYGDENENPSLPSLNEFYEYVRYNGIIEIIDNGDGSWSAEGPASNVYLLTGDPTQFEVDQVNATYLNATTFEVETTEL